MKEIGNLSSVTAAVLNMNITMRTVGVGAGSEETQ